MTSDRAKTRAGQCRFGTRTISLSEPLTRLHSDADVHDTILHEIAHALVGPEHGHDAVWRAKAISIGCSGERLVDADAPRVEGPWAGVCSAGHVYRRHRRPTRVLSCLTCSPTFDVSALLTWTYQGRKVHMGNDYRAELDEIIRRHGASAVRDAAPPAQAAPKTFAIGTFVRVVGEGLLHDAIGEVEASFPTRSQVRIGDELYAVPNDALELAERLAS